MIPRIEIHHAEKFELDLSDEDVSDEEDAREGSKRVIGSKKEKAKTVVINEPVVIKEYAGGIFRYLREIDGIKQESVIKSLNPEVNLKAIQNAGESQGKSGSFFFFSYDNKFIIKTMNTGELETFKAMFEDYFLYLTETNKNSMLARIYGIFTVYLEDLVPIHLILMKNTLQWVSGSRDHVDCLFDLKGSMHGRLTKLKGAKPTTVLKDQNIQIKRAQKLFLKFTKEDRRRIQKIMK